MLLNKLNTMIKFLKKVFSSSDDQEFHLEKLHRTIEPVENVLNDNQMTKAEAWYNNHRNHVNKITSETEMVFPPTDSEDKNNPVLWKPSHWKWYLENNH